MNAFFKRAILLCLFSCSILYLNDLYAETTHFKNVNQTPVSCTFIGNIQILGKPAQNNEDEIGVFVKNNDNSEILVGASVFGKDIENFYMVHVYQDDPLTTEKEGAGPNDALLFKIWVKDRNKEYSIDSDQMTYLPDNFLSPLAIPPVWSALDTFGLLNFTIVNTPPVSRDQQLTLDEDTTASLLLDIFDFDLQSLTSHIVSMPFHGTLTISENTAYYHPEPDYFGVDSFSYVTDDGEFTTSTSVVSITVNSVNDAPVFIPGMPVSVLEDTSGHQYQWINSENIYAGADNELSQTLWFIVSPESNTSLFRILPHISSTGILTFEINPDAFGIASFNVFLKDDGGTENNGKDLSQSGILTIKITNIPDAPFFTPGGDIIAYETGTPVSFIWATQISSGNNEMDQLEQFVVSTEVPTLFQKPPEISLDGRISFQPEYKQPGQTTVTVQLKDNADLSYGGKNMSDSVSFVISVEPVFYTLVIDPKSNGLIEVNGVRHTYYNQKCRFDDVMTIKAIPNTDMIFSNWHGNLSGSQNPVTIQMFEHKTIEVNFIHEMVLLTLEGNGDAMINSLPQTSLPVKRYFQKNSYVTIKAVPLENFLRWQGDCEDTTNPVSMVMNSNKTITAQFKSPDDWEMIINIDSEVVGTGSHHAEIAIGEATFPYTKIKDPLPEKYFCDIVVSERLNTDIRALDESLKIWSIGINPHGNAWTHNDLAAATLSWDPTHLPQEGGFHIIQGIERRIVVNDMRATTSWTITGTHSTSYYSIVNTPGVFTYQLKKGWNLISLPLVAESNKVQTIFPGYTDVYAFENGKYHLKQTIEPYQGYWLKMDEDSKFMIYGIHLNAKKSLLSKGWHIVGATFISEIPRTTPADCVEAVFDFNGSYRIVSHMQTGKGYWFKLKEDCSLFFESGSDPSN